MDLIHVEKVIQYWRNSLADAARMEINRKKLEQALTLPREEVIQGKISQENTKLLFNKAKREKKLTKDQQTNEIRFLDVLICPFVGKPRTKHGKANAYKRDEITPVWISAVLDEEGNLSIKKEGYVWIPRNYLEPTQKPVVTVGTVDSLDKFMTLNRPLTDDWSGVREYTKQMLLAVSGIDLDKEIPGERISSPLEEYVLLSGAYILLDTIQDGSNNILKIYDKILGSKKFSSLLQRFASLEDQQKVPLLSVDQQIAVSALHTGQMNGKFPLSPSQRETLHHFLKLNDGDILAVNGPPGTGKTTLLQSIVATLWVNAAIQEDEPPVIVAASTNNQAVTNIIDSFGKVEESDAELLGRWIPKVTSYGLYCPSSARAKEAKEKFQIMTTNGEGFPKDLAHKDKLNEKIQYYLEQCGKYAKIHFRDLEAAIQYLHRDLIRTVSSFQEGIRLLQEYNELASVLQEKYEEYGGLDSFILHQEETLKQLKADNRFLQMQVSNRETGVKKLSPWYKILWITSWGKKFVLTRLIKREIQEAKEIKKNLAQIENRWNNWKTDNFMRGHLDDDPKQLLDKMDVIRYKAFKLATHYWEGKWLQEVQEHIQSDSFNLPLRKQWKQYAKITPCFVSTLHMASRFFSDQEDLDPMIDLLIIDEAGQVSPEIAGATFALANKAIVVGDTLQIEPVWGVPRAIDIGNLFQSRLISKISSEEYEKFKQKGITASSGSAMEIAQRASSFQKFDEGGMFLREHRRCADEIIKYCNLLAYEGKLDPLAPPRKENHPLPYMGYANISGRTERRGGSRGNPIEANAIAYWIHNNKQRLLDLYKDEKGQKTLDEIVGIITPFTWQTGLITRRLKELGLDDITVGTVHSLQGAERQIVIFSPVYTREDCGTMFFDNGPNMLNVAVSRAKDSFLVFGDMSIFDVKSTKPSGLLAKILFEKPENEIMNVDVPSRYIQSQEAVIRHLITHESHKETLKQCIENAQRTVMIVSPFITRDAIVTDGIHQLIREAVKRGIEVTIYTDSRLNNHFDGKERETAKEGKQLLLQNGAHLKIADRIHNKTLCVDDRIMVEGSYNWLSAVRASDHEWHRFETSIYYENGNVQQFMTEVLTEMESRVIESFDPAMEGMTFEESK